MRIIEHKWFEFEKDEPHYAMNDEKNAKLYDSYEQLIDRENKVIFEVWLREYKYDNMN